MNRLILITNKQKLLICIASILFIILVALFISVMNFPRVVETTNAKPEVALTPEEENMRLLDLLSAIVPSSNDILYENKNRSIGDVRNSENDISVKTSDVLNKGKNLEFITVYSDENYLRPIHSSTWEQAYSRGWLYLPKKIINSRHILFTYEGNSTNIFDIEGDLGFYSNITVDSHNYINFLIYNFDLQNVTLLENQIVITGTPVKKGVQIISIKTEDILFEAGNSENITVQLCTPFGYEIDFQNLIMPSSEVLLDNYGFVDEAFEAEYIIEKNNSADIKVKNEQLKQELSHYISKSPTTIYFQQNGSYQTSDVLNSNIDLDDALQFSSSINYNIAYNNQKYLRPVFHPMWKEHYDREWCYIPRKMYLNMKKLFVLPVDKNIASDLCGELGFFEEYPTIGKNQIGLLIHNFSVKSVRIYENNVLVTGIPSRTGIQVVNLLKDNLKDYNEYAVRLITNDLCEIDVDVIKR